MRKPLEFILQKTADAIVTRERSKGGGKALSDEAEQGLKKYLTGPVLAQMTHEIGRDPRDVTFIFGHTHKPCETQYQLSGYPRTLVNVYNTGGWVVEKTTTAPIYGAAAVLLDDDLNVTSLRLYNEGKYEVQVKEVSGGAPGALTQHVRELVKKTAPTWNEFSRVAAEEIGKHKKYLGKRIRQMENL